VVTGWRTFTGHDLQTAERPGCSARRARCSPTTFHVPSDHQEPAASKIEVFAREGSQSGRLDGGRRPAVDALPQGGTRFGQPAPDSAGESWPETGRWRTTGACSGQRGTGLGSTPALRNSHGTSWQPRLRRRMTTWTHFGTTRFCGTRKQIPAAAPRGWSHGRLLGQSFGGFLHGSPAVLRAGRRGIREAVIGGGRARPARHATADDGTGSLSIVPRTQNGGTTSGPRWTRTEMGATGPHCPRPWRPRGDSCRGGRLTGASRAWRMLGDSRGQAKPGTTCGRTVNRPVLLGGGVARAVDRFPGPAPPPSVLKRGARSKSWLTRPLRPGSQGSATAGRGPDMAEFPEFEDPPAAAVDGTHVLFTGEMIYPWMFETRPGASRPLRGRGTREKNSPSATLDAVSARPGLRPATCQPPAAVYYAEMYVQLALVVGWYQPSARAAASALGSPKNELPARRGRTATAGRCCWTVIVRWQGAA